MKIKFIAIAALALIISGCDNNKYEKSIEKKNLELTRANERLEKQLQQTQSQNKELQQKVETLSSLDANQRLSGLYELKSVKITKHTNFYDRDKDGIKEKLIVYLQPMDVQGDLIKASGSVEVELWDLSKDGKEAMLAKRRIEPQELKEMWFAGVLKGNYRLMFDIADIIKSFDGQYIVKTAFTDYLSGRVFNEQYVIKQ